MRRWEIGIYEAGGRSELERKAREEIMELFASEYQKFTDYSLI